MLVEQCVNNLKSAWKSILNVLRVSIADENEDL